MSSCMNRATLIGYLGADPEIRTTRDGRKIANFSLATTKTWNDRNTGEKREQTEWHRVVVFNEGLAKIAEQFLKKGSRALVEGEISTRKWQDQNGQDRYSTEIVLQFEAHLILLDKAPGSGRPPAMSPDDYGQQSSRSSQHTDPQNPSRTAGSLARDMDDDIPF